MRFWTKMQSFVVAGCALPICAFSLAARAELSCPDQSDAEALSQYRDAVVAQLFAGSQGSPYFTPAATTILTAQQAVSRCFPSDPPACISRLKSYFENNRTAPAALDTFAKDDERKRPPAELLLDHEVDWTVRL